MSVFIKDPIGNSGRIVEHIPRTGMAYVPNDPNAVCYILKEKLSSAPRKELFVAEYRGNNGNGESSEIDKDVPLPRAITRWVLNVK